jgi:prevent-host-death family protein
MVLSSSRRTSTSAHRASSTRVKEYDYVMAKTVSADEAQTHLLDLIREHDEFVITDNGEPVARVVPIDPQNHGPMFGRVQFTGDVVAPLGEEWDANQ